MLSLATTLSKMDFTDAYRLTRAGTQHPYAYSPGSTFLATVQHVAAVGSLASSDGGSAAPARLASSTFSASSSISSSTTRGKVSLASLVQIRVSATLQVVREWRVAFAVASVRWSQDGTMLMCSSRERFVVLIVDPKMSAAVIARPGSTDNEDFAAIGQDCLLSVKAGVEGMSHAHWIGSETVCVFTCDHLTARLFDVHTGSATVVPYTKASSRCWLSPSQEYAAFLMRKDAADVLSIMTRSAAQRRWHTVEEFPCRTNDAVGVAWSADERFVAVWEGVLEFKLLVFSILGHLQASLTIDSLQPVTALPSVFCPSPNAALPLSSGGLGIRDVRWSSNGRFIVVGDYHDHIRFVETREWCECATFEMAIVASKAGRHGRAVGWKEPTGWQQTTGGRSIVGFDSWRLPGATPTVKPDYDKLSPKAGVAWMEWNGRGDLLAARSESVPNAIFVFATPLGREDGRMSAPHLISVVTLCSPVAHALWRPALLGNRISCEMVIVCQTQAVYVWRLDAQTENQIVEAIPIPIDNFSAVQSSFAPDGRTLTIVSETETYCCAMDAIEADVSLTAPPPPADLSISHL